MPRLFTAIELPEDARKKLAGICTGVQGAKWANPRQIHLTLRFIGNVDTETRTMLASALAGVAAAPFDITIRGLGTFPSDRKPARVLWAGVDSAHALRKVQQQVEAAVLQCGVKPQTLTWKPHITLARFSRPPGKDLQGWLEAHAKLALPPFRVNHFHLFESERGRQGAVHSIVQTYPLQS